MQKQAAQQMNQGNATASAVAAAAAHINGASLATSQGGSLTGSQISAFATSPRSPHSSSHHFSSTKSDVDVDTEMKIETASEDGADLTGSDRGPGEEHEHGSMTIDESVDHSQQEQMQQQQAASVKLESQELQVN